jgi:hypothetical protein
MATTLDRIPQEVRVPGLDPDVKAKPRLAFFTVRRLLRTVPDSWRFALACMRLSGSTDEGDAATVDARSVLERASSERTEG